MRRAILGHVQQGGAPSPFDRIHATRLASAGVDHLINAALADDPAGAMVGMREGKVDFTPLRQFPDLVEHGVQRPRGRAWWMALRPVADIMARARPRLHERVRPSADPRRHVCEPGAVRKFVMMGIQGSGKGTQAKLLADAFDLVQMSVGDILRWNVQNHTKLGAHVRRVVASGHLVEDDVVEQVIQEPHQPQLELRVRHRRIPTQCQPGRVLPRELRHRWGDQPGTPQQRGCPAGAGAAAVFGCGLDYNLIAHRPKVEDVCDMCASPLTVRSDDNPEALAVRLAEYHEKTRPVIEIFQRKEFVVHIDAMRSMEAIHTEICERFGLV